MRKANLKRKKALIKPPELSLSASSLLTTPLSTHPPSLLAAKNEPLTVPEESNKTKPGVECGQQARQQLGHTIQVP